MSTQLTSSAVTYFSGETVSLVITVLDDDDLAVNMSACTIKFEVVRKKGGTAVISTETSPQTATYAISNNTASPQVANIGTITVSAASTEALVGLYQFECKATDPSSNESVIAYGTINFKKNQID